ncbi:MAG TPA: helix-turn-helix transcriptional regulator [Pseudonocardiaceae bacterium]|nr:helix-turn-helix transcriptional regulator [Pseudonocardiaceae bacterium]
MTQESRSCTACGTQLSRYNRQPVCGPCGRSARGSGSTSDALPGEPAVGECLVRLRHEAGLTQQELADLAGLSRDLVRKLEQGLRATASVTSLLALARALKVPASALLEPSASPGLLLRAARRRQGMSQQVLAGRAGVTVSYVSLLENGHRALAHLPTIRALSSALGISPMELVPWLAVSGYNHICRCGRN